MDKGVEVITEVLILPGALTHCPAAHADGTAQLDRELAELDDVAQAAKRESNFHCVTDAMKRGLGGEFALFKYCTNKRPYVITI